MTAPVTPTGPFIVTHTGWDDPCGAPDCEGRCDPPCYRPVLYREAFATLEEGRRAVERRIREWRDADGSRVAWNQAYQALRDARGFETDGSFTLPNGDVIEVEATTWERVRSDLTRWDQHERRGATNGDALAAWNAEHGIGIGEER